MFSLHANIFATSRAVRAKKISLARLKLAMHKSANPVTNGGGAEVKVQINVYRKNSLS